ncbi:MAG: Fe-S cluster assembly protein NifU [Pseudomonadales bacterium]|nr:Fe-S cluster assembly protein NifU [Pseudomonadales bacterium]
MWNYSEKVQEHFFDPKNAGAVADANATGDVGSISCGDALRLTLKVNPETEVIEDAGFQTFGCGSAIASSSALTEMIKGKTLDQALEITNQDIADFLDGLPPEKMHCSVMGREALQAAVADYRGEEWVDDHEEGALICKCFAIDEVKIEETIRENNLRTVEEVTNYTKAGGGCSSCHEGIEGVLTRVLAEAGESFVPAGIGKAAAAPAPAAAAPAPAASGKASGMLKRIRTIEKVLEEIRPNLQADNGDVELVDVEGKNIYVHLTGACSGCQMAAMTLGGIQQRLIEELGEFVKVLPDTEMPVALEGA